MSRGHHLLFEKSLWNAHEPNKRLRQTSGLIIPHEEIYPDVHDKIHREIDSVPPPSYKLGKLILSNYTDNPDDHLRALDNLVKAIKESIMEDRVKAIGYQTGDLIITCLQAQREIIYENWH
jgi:hypothetical protein